MANIKDRTDIDRTNIDTQNKIQIQSISSRYREIMRRQLQGYSREELSKEFGITPQAITIITNSRLFIIEREKLEGKINEAFINKESEGEATLDTRDFLNNNTLEAAQGLINLMKHSKSDVVKQKSMIEILDRTGFKGVETPTTAIHIEVSQSKVDIDNAIAKSTSEVEKLNDTEKPKV